MLLRRVGTDRDDAELLGEKTCDMKRGFTNADHWAPRYRPGGVKTGIVETGNDIRRSAFGLGRAKRLQEARNAERASIETLDPRRTTQGLPHQDLGV